MLVLGMRFQGDFKEFCEFADGENASNQSQQKLQWLLQEHTGYSNPKFGTWAVCMLAETSQKP